jgi:hypothetical protein
LTRYRFIPNRGGVASSVCFRKGPPPAIRAFERLLFSELRVGAPVLRAPAHYAPRTSFH